MHRLYAILALALFGALCFVTGRYTAKPGVVTQYVELPQKTRTIVVREAAKVETKVVTRRVVVQPDGTSTTDEKEVSQSAEVETSKGREVEVVEGGTRRTDTPTVVTLETDRPSYAAGLLVGVDMPNDRWTFGGQVSWRAIGPVWMSVYGMSSLQFGIGASVQW